MKELMPLSSHLEIYPSLGDLPGFNPDFDQNNNTPKSVIDFRERVKASDAVLISTPEYAHGIPGMLKNALDWLVSETEFSGKRIGIIFGSATNSEFAKTSLLEVLRTMSATVNAESVLTVPGVRVKFDSQGSLTDIALKADLKKLILSLSK